MKISTFAAVAASACIISVGANASTLSGTFAVDFVNFNAGGTAGGAVATKDNFANRFAAASEDHKGSLTYTGDIDFLIKNEPADVDGESIADFFRSGTYRSFFAPTADFNDLTNLTLSNDEFQTTTLLSFTLLDALGPSDVTVSHDDGFTLYEDGHEVFGFSNPTEVLTTGPAYFGGGTFNLVYAAANGNPSKLHVDVSPVPLPASGLMLLAAIGGFGIARRKTSV